MSLKPSIFHQVKAQDISKRVVSEYSDLINLKLLDEGVYTVICFPGMRNNSSSIINSKTLLKAIKRAGEATEKIVVVAHNFTSESLEVLNAVNAIEFSKSNFYWTDERLANIREK